MNIWLFFLLTLIVVYIYLSNGKSSKYMKQHKKGHPKKEKRFENDFLPTLKLKRFHREPPDVEHAFEEEHSDRYEISLPDFHDEHHAEVFGHVYTHNGDLVGASGIIASELGYDVENCHVCRHYAEEYFDQESEDSGVDDHGDYYYHDDPDFDYYFEVRGSEGSESDVEDYVLDEDDDQDCCSCNCQRRHIHRPAYERDQDGNC